MKIKDNVKKSRSSEVEESRSSGTGFETEAPGRGISLLNSPTSRLLNFSSERTGNVYENKGLVCSRSQVRCGRPEPSFGVRQLATRPPNLAPEGCEQARSRQERQQTAVLQSEIRKKSGNKPRMSMKTKDRDKKSWSSGVQELRAESRAAVDPGSSSLVATCSAPQLPNSLGGDNPAES